FFFFQAEDGIRDRNVTGVQTCALPISTAPASWACSALKAESQLVAPRSSSTILPARLVFVPIRHASSGFPLGVAYATEAASGLSGRLPPNCNWVIFVAIGTQGMTMFVGA